MIAVVSSTIKPREESGQKRSFYSFEMRLNQTRQTLTRLQECGFSTIYLVDNSPSLDQHALQKMLTDFSSVKVYHILQYQFTNKGINELLMLLFIAEHLTPNEPIFKISGRYYPTPSFVIPHFTDFAIKGYDYVSKKGTISTRGYWVKDAKTMQYFLQCCLTEVFTYPQRIVGIRSLLNNTAQMIFKRPFTPVNTSIEFAAANILKKGKYEVTQLSGIGIEGLVAGAVQHEKITE
jgi:hypothetical protein